MYTQALNTQDSAPAAKGDPQADARFQARVDAEEKIEPINTTSMARAPMVASRQSHSKHRPILCRQIRRRS